MHGDTISWAITAGSLTICELQRLQHVISVTCQKSLGYQWPQRNHGETRPAADGVTVGPPLPHGHTAARLPWLSYSPSLTLFGKENTPFSPRNNSFRFCSHPHPFQMLEDWYQCDSSHRVGKAALVLSSDSHSLRDRQPRRQSHHVPWKYTLHWEPLELPQFLPGTNRLKFTYNTLCLSLHWI